MRPFAVGLCLATLLAACGSDSSDSSDSSATPAPIPATTEPTPAGTTTAEPEQTTTEQPTTEQPTTAPGPEPVVGSELIGRWAHYDVVAYEDDLLKTLIISFGFNDFTEVDGEIIDQASFCFSEQRTDQSIETSLSDAATQAILPPPTPVSVEVVDGELHIQRPATPTAVGIRLDDPFNESLPTDPADPRIVDDDGDGNPGITVSIRVSDEISGELYIARREIFAYDAALVEPGRIVGEVIDDSEQLVIGASDPIFATSPANWDQHPDLTKSPIILVRVDADWDCERLAAERDAIFPPTPDIDW